MSSTFDVASLWTPRVLGRAKLDQRHSSYVIEAPFEMEADIRELIGTTLLLDDRAWEIRGSVPSMPTASVRKGQPIELLVAARI
ncbi:hypothetical protein [uncultured Enterovirga sp.]|uniref:hypothetical protein n=1 Tax=uncultured Enterovirga sp. TaxID=2026352 RepID=UPI0035CBA90F